MCVCAFVRVCARALRVLVHRLQKGLTQELKEQQQARQELVAELEAML